VMNTNKVNVQNDAFFADLHEAFDKLESDFNPYPVVLTGLGDVFSAGIDFQYSFDIFGSGNLDKIREWYRNYRATNLRIFQYARPTVAAVNGHAIAGGLSQRSTAISVLRPGNLRSSALTRCRSASRCRPPMSRSSNTRSVIRSARCQRFAVCSTR